MSPSDKPSSRRSWVRSGFIWSRRAGTLVVLLVALVLAATAVLWTTSGDYLAGRVTDLLNHGLFAEETRLSVGRIGGFPLDQLILENVRLERRNEEGWFPFLSADRLRVSYDLWGLIHGRNDFRRVEADGLRLELRSDKQQAFLVPTTRRGGGGEGGGGGPAIRIQHIELRASSLYIELPVSALDLDQVDGTMSLERGTDFFRVDVKQLRGSLREDLGDVVLERGAFVVTDDFAIEDLAGTWEDSPLTADGRPGGANQDLRVTVERLPLERLGRFLHLDTLGPGWVDRAEARFYQENGAAAFTWTGDGVWDVWRLEGTSGQGVVRDGMLFLSETGGRTGGATISGGRAEIPLEGPGLTLSARFAGVRLEDLPVEALAPYAGTVSGVGRVTLGNRDDPMASLSAQVTLEAGQIMEVPFRRARGVVRIEGGTVFLDTVQVSLAAAEFHGRGQVGVSTLDLGFRYQGDLKPWRHFLKREDLVGSGLVDVIIHGPRERPELAASGMVTGLEVANLRAPRIALRRAEGPLLGGRRLEVDFLAPDGVTLAGTPFSRAEGSLVVTDSLLTMDALELARGDTTVTVVGNLRWEPRVEIEVERAAATFDGRRFTVETPALIVFNEGLLSTPGLEVRTRRGTVTVAGDWDTRDQRVEARCLVDDLDFSVFFPPDDPPPVRVGSASGTIEMTGAFPVVNGRGDLRLKAVEWEGGSFDSLRAVFRVEDRTIHVDRLETRLQGGLVSVSGSIGLPRPLYETLEAVAVGPDLDPEALLWDLGAEISDIRLGEWFAFLERRDRPTGRLNARLRLEGTAAHPRLLASAEAGGLVWRRFTADSVLVRVSVAEGNIEVDTLTTWQGTRRVDVSGTAPLDLTLYPFAWELPNREMDLLVNSEEGDLSNLKLTPWVDEAHGSLKARIRITGTPRLPLLEGRAEVEGATVRPVKRDEVLENVRAVIRFDRDLVTVEEAHADMGGGKVSAAGTYRLHAVAEQSYELQVTFDKAVVRQEGEYAARVSGTLTLHPVVAKDGRVYPFAEGDIFVHRAEYAGSLEPQDIGQFEPQPILYSVRINAPDKILVMTEDVNVVLGGELTVRQDVDARSVLGELEILRGTYRLFLEEFRISEGRLTWNDPSTVIPEMDVQAETPSPPYLVLVSLTGRIDAPVITFSALSLEDRSEVGLSQSEIIQHLAFGSVGMAPPTLGLGTGEAAAGQNGASTGPGTLERGLIGASGLFKGQLERELARQLGIVDEVQIDIDPDQYGVYLPMLGVRKWVTPELSIQYRQGLSRTFDQDLAVEYRLRRAIFLRGEVLRREQQGGQPTQQYNVDLKVRHDY